MTELSALITRKYSYFQVRGTADDGIHHYIPHYSCGLLTNSALMDRFERNGGYTLRFEDHNFRYRLRVSYAEGDSLGLGLMVKSIGVLAEEKTGSKKTSGVFYETTPHFIEGPASSGLLVYQLASNHGGEIPLATDNCMRAAAAFHNFIGDHGIAPRDSTDISKFKEVFGEGNAKFLSYFHANWQHGTLDPILGQERRVAAFGDSTLLKLEQGRPVENQQDEQAEKPPLVISQPKGPEKLELMRQIIRFLTKGYESISLEGGSFFHKGGGKENPTSVDLNIEYDLDDGSNFSRLLPLINACGAFNPVLVTHMRTVKHGVMIGHVYMSFSTEGDPRIAEYIAVLCNNKHFAYRSSLYNENG